MRVMRVARVLILVGLTGSVGGCATTIPPIKMDAAELARLRNEAEIVAIHYPTANFVFWTPGKARTGAALGPFGAIGALQLARSEGEALIAQYSLEDPALRIAKQVLAAIKDDPGLQNIRAQADPVTVSGDGLPKLRKGLGPRVVLDFKTTNWLMSYWPMRVATNYRVIYSVVSRLARLDDSRDPQVLWRGACTSTSATDAESSPPIEQLKANDGALLKAHMNKVADLCAAVLIAQFRGQEVGPSK